MGIETAHMIGYFQEIKVLDFGFVRLDGCMASDLSVVNSARVSFNKRHEEIEEGDDKLIAYLMREKHGTPFEHNSFRFHIKAPIFIFREWQRHRIGSFNEWSARYSQLKPEFYIPNKENVRCRVGKPGRYTYEPVDVNEAAVFREILVGSSNSAYRFYEQALNKNIAPEIARLFLPVNIYSEMYWTVNARSLMNFLSLRNSETAQWEIQQYAKVIEKFFEQRMPITYEVFLNNGRVAP